ncbi:PREDICTED: uncharacterized protein LOC109157308 [Ipomoea nil]|uniref:uncharacterized protein LOC109157308 n=1 Tax=Ipomoea nil TaxID=35883 RepID=UPI00090137AE|nr:PREDICTED: uncharacterized protein LOC109157308 [Ipomoea nil]
MTSLCWEMMPRWLTLSYVAYPQLSRSETLAHRGFFLGIETIAVDGGLVLSQRCYMTDILSRSGMVDCKPLATPAAVTQVVTPSFMHSPTNDHWGLLKWVLRYVKGTLDYGLRLSASSSSAIHAFSESDWTGCPIDRKSTTEYAIFLGSNLISWLSRKQRTVARSSTEAEYKALVDVSAEVTWVVSLLRELDLHSG